MSLVAPYVGAWIETWENNLKYQPNRVAPYVGAWIETTKNTLPRMLQQSHPTWVRGLKLFNGSVSGCTL